MRTAAFILLAVVLAVPALAGSAQTPEPSALPDPSEMEGIERAVVRTWSVDFDPAAAATPGYAASRFGEGLSILSGFVLQFDSADQAADAYTVFTGGVDDELLALGTWDDPTIASGEIPEIGNQAYSATVEGRIEEYTEAYRYVVVLREQYLIIAAAAGATLEDVAAAEALARWMTEEGTPGNEDETWEVSGTSTGGLWGFFPPDQHELLDGLSPINDDVLYPATDDTAGWPVPLSGKDFVR
jgi:hypothetical protein